MKNAGLKIHSNISKYVVGSSLVAFIILVSMLILWKDRSQLIDELQALFIDPETDEQELTFISPTYEINRIYKSMKGPFSKHQITLLKSEKPELIWITGYKAVMVGQDGDTPMPQEFMCHSNLDIDIAKHKELFGWEKNNPSGRLFTLSQGQLEIEFPEGFGIPILSTEPLSLVTQVLNLNDPNSTYQVRHKITFKFIRDIDLKTPMKPLIQIAAIGLKLLNGKDGYFNVANANEDTHGPGCSVGQNADSRIMEDQFDRKFTLHWVVDPGREVNHTLATKYMNVAYDTTIHYIAVHLHPYAESLELKDLTTGNTVFKSKTRLAKDRIGIEEVEHYSSENGIPLYKDHEYQLISVYNNTSNEDQDSMATMFMYVLDREFKKPIYTVPEEPRL